MLQLGVKFGELGVNQVVRPMFGRHPNDAKNLQILLRNENKVTVLLFLQIDKQQAGRRHVLSAPLS